MNQNLDVLIILIVKLLLIVGFIAAIKFWLKKNKKKNNIPMIIYWVLGVFFVLILSTHIFEFIRGSFSYSPESLLNEENSGSSLSLIVGFSLYLYVGLKYLKRV
jgi:RsiW-degrading membrane proteinase PrsW (M82 family)